MAIAYGKTTETGIRPTRGTGCGRDRQRRGHDPCVIGTIFLILLVTGLLFLCIFAYYVKNCLQIWTQLSDFTVSLSSSILGGGR